ncbi:murein transglycosylase A [Desulfopila aestuarii]|uniref:peptidoglycan lytic exotransglycosylase n=1 Tax=Desulfopila aestuarii DSM 18488 TaxID=1121416 RepID=A0A1M7YAN2_9BACT|nr:MltA domain-containing protein [Desulfopila aestuarii]SHO49694.1 membrane-bound lytic murein transglycosylase A [Desulfopila aestuarii DSM 18488]
MLRYQHPTGLLYHFKTGMVMIFSFRCNLLTQLLTILLLAGCAMSQPYIQAIEPDDDLPIFLDDGDRANLLECARIHTGYLAKLPKSHQTNINGTRYSRDRLLDSMESFIDLLEQDLGQEAFSEQLRKNFTVIQAEGRRSRNGEMLVTGYYEPLIAGSLKRRPPYIYPLYRAPKSLITTKDPKTGKKKVGRIGNDGKLRPFWTRAEIDSANQPLKGNELVYLKDPLDAFLLHVQGSGRVLLPDNSERSVRFSAHNGHDYKSIGKLLVDEGKLTLQQSSIPAIRRYLEQHPEDEQRVLNQNPRYIFFRWGSDEPPKGSLGRPLTAGRSIAIDRKALPDTLFGWLETSIPVINKQGIIVDWQISRRFVLPQDSGAAIKGPGRVDLFWGNGPFAEIAAGNMKQAGRLYFFVKK